MDTPRRLFISSYDAYNSGAFDGRWHTLDDYDSAEELEAAIVASCAKGAEEFLIADAEGFPAALIGQYTGHCEAWAWHEAFESASSADAFAAFLEAFGSGYFTGPEQALEIFTRIGYDLADSTEEFAQGYAENRGLIPSDMDADDIRHFIDWQGYWNRKLCFEYTAYRFDGQLFFFLANW